ncbi:hypothetical protein ASPCAL12794 [Aspergillus calidoustus]|uniref:Uncharacterized protein n=1 Tax=Aspergillus calidoustus TaxID=454130 RepID=A0A0U5GF14_ASPCI|nr:hypothetical protein ASPCAL12794 [Aspergillus calidoustus]
MSSPSSRGAAVMTELVFNGIRNSTVQPQREVHQVLAQPEDNGATADSPRVREKAQLIINGARHEAGLKGSWLDLFGNNKLQIPRRIILGALPQFLQQFTGINAVVYFGPTIFSNSVFVRVCAGDWGRDAGGG